MKGLKDQLDRQQLVAWLKDPEVMKSRKRLYYTLLGVSNAGDEELAFLEDIIRSGDRDRQAGLDALIACYLTLKGDAGVPLIEEVFLNNPDAEYIDVFSAISALRFHGTESDVVSKPRIVEALRFVLDRPKMADMVIPDLARWEDWSVMDRLVQMFKDCDSDETRWVRTPIISYLQACPHEQAKQHIQTLREIDPDAAKRADMLAELDWGDEDDDWGDEKDTAPSQEASDKQPPQPLPESTADTKQGAGPDGKTSQKTGKDKTGKDKTGKDKTGKDKTGDKSGDKSADGPDGSQGLSWAVPNPRRSAYVTTSTAVPSADSSATEVLSGTESPRSLDLSSNQQLAQRLPATPPAALMVPTTPSTMVILLSVIGICGLLFLLLWTVLDGKFVRLIS